MCKTAVTWTQEMLIREIVVKNLNDKMAEITFPSLTKKTTIEINPKTINIEY